MADIPSTPADGKTRVALVTAIADTTAPKVATELAAASSVDISCYLTGDGFNPSLTEQVIADERLCSRQTYENKGRHSRGLSLTYIDNTGGPNATTFNKAKDTLVPGSPQYLVIRRGIDYETAWATGQKVTVYPITPGEYDELPPEANSVQRITQKQFVTGKVQVGVLTVT